MSNISIWLIDKALSSAITPDQSGPVGAMAMKGHSIFPQAPVLLELRHQIV